MAGKLIFDEGSGDCRLYHMLMPAYRCVFHGAYQPEGYYGAVFEKRRQPCEYPCGERHEAVSEGRDVEDQSFQLCGDECVRGNSANDADEREY